MAQSLLSLLIRKDTVFPKEGVSVFVKLMTHDSLKTRKMSVGFFGGWLKITRPKAVKKPLSAPVAEGLGGAGGITRWPIKWGLREDNVGLLYTKEGVPKSEKEWDETQFVDKTHWGVYVWPK